MLSTLISLLPTRFKWIRRLRFAALLLMMVYAWIKRQNTQADASAPPDTVTATATRKRKTTPADA